MSYVEYRYLPRNMMIPAPGPVPFDPTQLSTLVAWWDGSDTSSLTQASNLVSQWNDKSGNGHHFIQATGANQPSTGTRTQNGLNVIGFDGARTMVTGAFAQAQPYTLMFSIVLDSVAGDQGVFADTGGLSPRIEARTTASGGWRVLNGATLTSFNTMDTAWHTMAWVINGSNPFSRIENDNGLLTSGDAGASSLATALRISGYSDGTTKMNGAFGEIVMFSGVSATDRSTIFTYLQTKWGTP